METIKVIDELTPDDLWGSIENKQNKHSLILNNLSLFEINDEDTKPILFALSPSEEEVISVLKDTQAVGVYTKNAGHLELHTDDGRVEIVHFTVNVDTNYTLTVHRKMVNLYDYVPLDDLEWDFVDIYTEHHIKLNRADNMNISESAVAEWLKKKVNLAGNNVYMSQPRSVREPYGGHKYLDSEHDINVLLLTLTYGDASIGYDDVISTVDRDLFEADTLVDGGVMYTISFSNIVQFIERLEQVNLGAIRQTLNIML